MRAFDERDERIIQSMFELKSEAVPTTRLSWWKRRGERELYRTHTPHMVEVGKVDRHGDLITSVIREKHDTRLIYGFGIPCYIVMGKPA